MRMGSERGLNNVIYHEVDFPSNTSRKIAAIRKSPHVLSSMPSLKPEDGVSISASGDSLYSQTYSIHPFDLRELAADPDSTQSNIERLPNLSTTAPTLLLSECCLIYLPPAAADAVLSTFANRFIPAPTPLALIIYEPIRPNDAFGQVMIANLATRGIQLQTLKRYSSLYRQLQRLKTSGFASGQRAADVDFLWEHWVSKSEKERVSGLEMLDELEEWRLLAQHYCVAWGWRDGDGDGMTVFKEAWGGIQSQDVKEDDKS
jgi:[phosphatase 2A protein]-leucine-carboxy methyltransferase